MTFYLIHSSVNVSRLWSDNQVHIGSCYVCLLFTCWLAFQHSSAHRVAWLEPKRYERRSTRRPFTFIDRLCFNGLAGFCKVQLKTRLAAMLLNPLLSPTSPSLSLTHLLPVLSPLWKKVRCCATNFYTRLKSAYSIDSCTGTYFCPRPHPPPCFLCTSPQRTSTFSYLSPSLSQLRLTVQ